MLHPAWKWTKGIAIVGAESSGKSFLLQNLACEISVPIIKELVRTTMKDLALDSPPAYGCNFQLTQEFQAKLQEVREKKESVIGGPFFADRSSIDSYAYTLACCGRDPESQQWLEEFSKQSFIYADKMYQLFILVPSGKFPMTPDGVRNPLKFNAMLMHYLILGILIDLNLPHYVVESVDIDHRTSEVLDLLKAYNLLN
jgi:nicotinamide riboside kinase